MLLLSSTFPSRASLAAAFGLMCFAGAAVAMPEDTFPQAPTRADILRWLAGNSDLNPESVVTMTDDVVVAITARQDGRGVGRSTRLGLREEIINPDAAAAWGGRSIQLDLDLDCARHRAILGTRRIYARPNLQGSARITRSDNAWAEVPADTVIDDVAKVACAPPAVQAVAGPAPVPPKPPQSPQVQVAGAEPPSAKTVSLAPPAAAAAPSAAVEAPPSEPPAPADAPPPAPLRLAAAEPPSPKLGPPETAAADPGPRVVSFDPPSPAPPAAVTLAAPSGASVAVISVEPAVVHNPFVAAEGEAAPPEPAPPAEAAAPSPPPPPAGPPARPALAAAPPARPPEFAVQIAAVASADLARDSWQSLKAKLPSLVGPRTFAVEPVEAKGRTLYRALLLGFASPDEAAALCKALRSQSVDCILRQMK